MARNLVVCNWRHSGPGRVGLSLGGGGVPDAERNVCEDGLCKVEHTGGQVISNIVAQCPTEPGLYLNAAENARVSGNLFFRTTGIQLHSLYASADIVGNIMNGGVRDRDGSRHTARHNEIFGFRLGTFLPAISAYVQRRLEGQDAKFPSLISPAMVDAAQSFVRWMFDFLIGSPLGLGMTSMSKIVADSDALDFTLSALDDFHHAGLTYAETDTDFCDRSRHNDATIGPFVSGREPCRVADRVQRVLDLEQVYPVD